MAGRRHRSASAWAMTSLPSENKETSDPGQGPEPYPQDHSYKIPLAKEEGPTYREKVDVFA
jgi:hypothetical protein